MDDAWHGLEAYADAVGLSLSNQISTGHMQLIDCYALQTVLRNLLRNAIEHAGPATLTVTLVDSGSIALRDNGKGIHVEDLPSVFKRYYSGRLHDAQGANEIDASRGLGLAICQACVRYARLGFKCGVRVRRPYAGYAICAAVYGKSLKQLYFY